MMQIFEPIIDLGGSVVHVLGNLAGIISKLIFVLVIIILVVSILKMEKKGRKSSSQIADEITERDSYPGTIQGPSIPEVTTPNEEVNIPVPTKPIDSSTPKGS